MNLNKHLILIMAVVISLGLAQGAFADTQEVTPTGGTTDIRYFDGKVGIGTPSPSKDLHVVGEVKIGNYMEMGDGPHSRFTMTFPGTGGKYIQIYYNSPYVHFTTSAGTSLCWSPQNRKMYFGDGTKMYIVSTGNDKKLIIYHNDSDGIIETTVGDIVLNPSGNVGIGTTSPTNKLHVVGNGYFTGTVTTGSSRSLKKGIESLNEKEAIKALQKLKPVKFFYKANDKDQKLGFISEDVPGLVAEKDRKSLSAMDLVTLSIKVIQEQQDRIEKLEKTVADLSNNKI